ncbi:MAG: ATP-binding cassette domain-containing protein [Chloroflexi bacterium]|nr:ATP-binding cassette domain-containing protein [Chloroflexota bacterium]
MTTSPYLIEAQNVVKRFGPIAAVQGVSFTVARGEVVGFLGPNGAGKTTTMRLLTGYYRPDAGRVLIGGLDNQEHDLETKRNIGYLPENNPLYGDLPVAEHLALAAKLRRIGLHQRASAMERAVEQTGLEEVFYRPVNQLSRGYRQRVGIALAILHEPDVLILDEPTEGLDPNQRVEIRELIQRLGQDHTVLLSTHVLQEVEHTCQRLMVIHRGTLVANAPAAELVQRASGARHITVELDGGDAAADLAGLPGVRRVDTEDGPEGRRRYLMTVSREEEDPRPRVFSLAAQRGWVLWELFEEAPRLEEIFRLLTQTGEEREQAQERGGG